MSSADISRIPDNAILAIDLFCGAGGATLGLSRSGIKVVAGVDVWETAIRSYKANFDHVAIQANIREETGKSILSRLPEDERNIDVVLGGPPCQGFSLQRRGSPDDERNQLITDFARIVGELRPRVFVMENVLGLLGPKARPLLDVCRRMLADAGYVVRVTRIDAADYGVPQNRKRAFVYGWLADKPIRFTFPKPTRAANDRLKVSDAIGDLEEPPDDHSPTPGDPLHRKMRLSERNLQRIRLVPPGAGFESIPVELRADCHKEGPERIGRRFVYGRMAGDCSGPTITARFDSFTRGKFGHPSQDRNITLREGARLQTFPDDFVLLGTQEDIAAQIGNAIPPRVAEVIGRSILLALEGNSNGFVHGSNELHDGAQMNLFSPVVGS